MIITRLELTNFRNHQHFVLDDIQSVLVIVGKNAVGKTNIVEALQLLSMHESFRQPKGEELIYNKRAEGEETTITVDLLLHESRNTKQIIFDATSRVFLYNNKERPARELVDVLPAVLFTPDDLQIIKGAPERRRTMLDSLGARLSKTFAQIRTDYNKALRHKNSLLRQEEVDRNLLDSWNIHLAKLGTSLSKHRRGLFKQIEEVAAESYKKISGGEELTGEYLASWEVLTKENYYDALELEREILGQEEAKESDLYKVLALLQEKEIAAKRALVGPQRDDIIFEIDGCNARRFASQGQQRSIALALKIAEIEILRRVSGREPLLLLDDVMSELDTARRGFFMDLISKDGQTVLTTTNLGYFEEEFLNRATVVKLKE